MVYIIFGKAGSGKSYIGDLLENQFDFIHFDGDSILTEEMKSYIREEKTFTQSMVDDYVNKLSETIKNFYDYQKPVIISQALYRNKNRLELIENFPNIKFILANAKDDICYDRIEKRGNWVSVNYAKQIRSFFEEPKHSIINIENDLNGKTHIILQIKSEKIVENQ